MSDWAFDANEALTLSLGAFSESKFEDEDFLICVLLTQYGLRKTRRYLQGRSPLKDSIPHSLTR